MPFQRPRLKAHLRAEPIHSSRVFIVGEERAVMLDRPVDVAILPLLDGFRSLEAVATELADRFSVADVFRSVQRLQALGLLAEGRPALPEPELAYWDAVGLDAGVIAEVLPASAVRLVGVGRPAVEPFAAALRQAGIAVEVGDAANLSRATAASKASDSSLLVVLADDYLAPEFAALNETMLASGRAWLLVKPSGITAWLGPLLVPGSTGCWACLRQRLHENRQVERYLNGRRGSEPMAAAAPEPPAGAQTLAGLLVPDLTEVLATGHSSRLEGRLVSIDRLALAAETHVLVRQPQCPACGDASLITKREPQMSLEPRDVRFSSDGGYRTEPPEETYRRLRKHVSPILGAVTALVPVTETESGVTFSYAAGHNFALIGDNMPLLRRNLRGQSGGKGRTDVQARVSAMAEAIERYCGVWRGDEPVFRASYDELDGVARLHPADVLLYSETQYDNRPDTHDQSGGRYSIVPKRFKTDVPCDWTTTWSLTNERPVLVPSGHVWFGHPDIESHFFTYGDGNGNASGSVREEAVLQATCELIERDAVALWWYNRLQRPALDLDSLDDPYVETLRRYYRSLGREFWVLDITSDLGVPAYAAISRRLDPRAPEDVILGFGAHIDPYLAAMRALTEMNQFLPAVTRRDADGNTVYLEDDPGALDWWKTVRAEDEPWLLPRSGPATTTADHDGLIRESLTEDVRGLLDRLRDAGMEVLVADQSRPDLDLSVVKIIVPGLRHFWRRLAPGRLYDVPVAMGWLPAPYREDELNPKSVFF